MLKEGQTDSYILSIISINNSWLFDKALRLTLIRKFEEYLVFNETVPCIWSGHGLNHVVFTFLPLKISENAFLSRCLVQYQVSITSGILCCKHSGVLKKKEQYHCAWVWNSIYDRQLSAVNCCLLTVSCQLFNDYFYHFTVYYYPYSCVLCRRFKVLLKGSGDIPQM